MKKNIKCRKIQEPDSSNLDSQIKTRKYIDSDNNSLEIENYIQDEIDAQIAEYDTLNSLEDIYTSVIIDVDDFNFELACELKQRLKQSNNGTYHSNKSDNTVAASKYEFWIRILKQIDGFITSEELDVLDKCIGTYASVCTSPYERRKEISRNMYYLSSWFEIDLLEFDSKIYRIDVQILYELTEILLELENLFYCSPNPENNFHSSLMKNDWPISTFYYCWEIFDLDCIEWYEIQAEISWVANGLIQDIWDSDHVIFIMDEHNGVSTEYDYYVNQFIDNDQHNTVGIDLGDLECLSEDDIAQCLWIGKSIESNNIIDYFWEAEITEICVAKNGDFHTEYRDYFSEHEYDNYSKYLCYQGDSGFCFCKKESCEGCSRTVKEKIINPQYILWEKYVLPIELV